MKRLILISLISVIAMTASAEIIFVDINDAPAEINACEQGLADKAAKTGIAEPLERTSGKCEDPSGVIFPKDAAQRGKQSDTYWCLRNKVATMLAQGRRIDSLVISGEDGSGHFFGSNGDFYARELQMLYKEFPQLNSTLKSSALWGCYPTSVHGAEQFWMTPNPAMQFTMGFTIQGPDKTREVNHDLLRQFCERREEAAQATTEDALCDFYDSLRQITRTNLGLCNQTSVASKDYAYPGMEDKDYCFSRAELHERCKEFPMYYDANVQMYSDYRTGARDDFEYNANGGLSDLRKFYNQVQLWRHCSAQFKEDRGFDLPYAPDLIRLIKYKKLTENIMKMNKPELAQYDTMLQNMGLGAFKLGDISKIPRRELVAKIQQAIVALEQLEGGANSVTVDGVASSAVTEAAPEPEVSAAPEAADVGGGFLFSDEMFEEPAAKPPVSTPAQPASSVTVTKDADGLVNNISTAKALRMAQCLRQALVNTSSLCTRFSMVSDHAKTPSRCVISYERAGELNKTPKGPNDAC